ncbi:MAG: tyrosinase family protein [Bryobacteraceae bacterium]
MASPLTRKDAWKLSKISTWEPTLLWYAKAVGEMSTRPATDPTSWRFQGAIHGYNSSTDPFLGTSPVPGAHIQKTFWKQCQHGTWFFLPWHRMYLGFFEQIVRATIVKLGGPANWTLPYWNYSDTSNPNAKVLPPAFRETKLPDGTPNPLFVIHGINIPRATGIDAGHPNVIPDSDVDLNCLTETVFTAASSGGDPGFGGPQTGFQHNPAAFGALESVPHNIIHVDVGGSSPVDGWMIDPDTAALDPIFWLHHSNIDRLWSVWNRMSTTNTDPASKFWLTKLPFKFHNATGAVVSMTPSQVLDTTTSIFSYDYEDTSDPLAPHVAPMEASVPTRSLVVPPQAIPEMVGASEAALTLTGSVQTMTFPIAEPTGPAAPEAMTVGAPAAPPRKSYLNIEHVTGEKARTTYDVYVNLPDNPDAAAYKDHYAGPIAMFGVSQASVPSERHPGTGVHYSLDITRLIDRLKARNAWNDEELRVAFVPRGPQGAALESVAPVHEPIRVGRVSLYRA